MKGFAAILILLAGIFPGVGASPIAERDVDPVRTLTRVGGGRCIVERNRGILFFGSHHS
jgi:hypothetical protein